MCKFIVSRKKERTRIMKHTLPKAFSMDKGCVIPRTLHLIKQLLPGHDKNGNSLQ